MSHLTLESLARLVDESPMADEAAHLAGCARCRDALDDLRAQTAALGALPGVVPPDDAWEKIVARVEADRVTPPRREWSLGLPRAAAAVVLFALGAAAGAALTRSRSVQAPTQATPPAARQTTGVVTVAEPPATPEVALMRLRIAEVMYTSALLDYAAITSPEPPKDAVARLATLETIVLTTRTALERAPADPLINSYHLAALAERETLLGQLRRTPEKKQWY
jgi:hypothetical protein